MVYPPGPSLASLNVYSIQARSDVRATMLYFQALELFGNTNLALEVLGDKLLVTYAALVNLRRHEGGNHWVQMLHAELQAAFNECTANGSVRLVSDCSIKVGRENHYLTLAYSLFPFYTPDRKPKVCTLNIPIAVTDASTQKLQQQFDDKHWEIEAYLQSKYKEEYGWLGIS